MQTVALVPQGRHAALLPVWTQFLINFASICCGSNSTFRHFNTWQRTKKHSVTPPRNAESDSNKQQQSKQQATTKQQATVALAVVVHVGLAFLVFCCGTMSTCCLKEHRKHRLQCGCQGGVHGTAAALAQAAETGSPVHGARHAAEQVQRMRAIARLEQDNAKGQVKKAFIPKIFEHIECADCSRSSLGEAEWHLILLANIFDFVHCVVFRELRSSSDGKKRKRDAGTCLCFIPAEHEKIDAVVKEKMSLGQKIPEPKEGISCRCFDQLKCALKTA